MRYYDFRGEKMLPGPLPFPLGTVAAAVGGAEAALTLENTRLLRGIRSILLDRYFQCFFFLLHLLSFSAFFQILYAKFLNVIDE